MLIAEPDVWMAAKLAAQLMSSKYEVVLAHDGFTALGLALFLKPKVVITELVLPYLPGHELCERLRSHAQTSTATIIALAHQDVELALLPAQRRFDACVPKPYVLANILQAMDAVRPPEEAALVASDDTT